MGVRIEVDRVLCQGHGVCESEAPEVFEVGADKQVVVLQPTPPDDLRPGIELAVKYCPTHALALSED